MAMQRFVGKDMKSALLLVKDTVGDDAMILADRSVPGGIEVLVDVPTNHWSQQKAGAHRKGKMNQKGLEAIPVMGCLPQSSQNSMKPHLRSAEVPKKAKLMEQPIVNDFHKKNDETNRKQMIDQLKPCFDDIRREFKAFASDINNQMRIVSQGDKVLANPMLTKLVKRLDDRGFSERIILKIIKKIDPGLSLSQAWKVCARGIARGLKIRSHGELTGVHVMLGPTGSGKTTTIAKMATQTVKQYGPDSVAILTTDRHRLGAVEQMKALSSTLGVSMGVVDEKRSFSYWLKVLANKRLVLVDTAGFHPRSEQWRKHLMSFLPLLKSGNLTAHLVLPANGEEAFLKHVVQSYHKVPVASVIITKVDEAIVLGQILSCLLSHQLPIAWYCDGQKIPDDLHAADAKRLTLRAMKKTLPSNADNQVLSRIKYQMQTNQIMESIV